MKKQHGLIGKTARLNKNYAKWILDHPEIYEVPGKGLLAKHVVQYEEETLIHLMCLMGVPIEGKILRENTYSPDPALLVKFKIQNLKMEDWVSRNHITVID